MKSRNKTLGQNIMVYLGILAVLGADLYFGMLYVPSQKKEEKRLKGEISRLESDWKRKDEELKRADQKAEQYTKEIARRKEELKDYGDFLPSATERASVQKFILQTIEDLNIIIEKTEEIKQINKASYSTLDVAVTLKGTYRDFKLLLARIHRSERVIRVKKFDMRTLDDDQHMQSVEAQFQTYFASVGS
jgi:Tfp pilus assembly protein PilO